MVDGADSPHLRAAVELDQQVDALRNKIDSLLAARDREIFLARVTDHVWPRVIAAALTGIGRETVMRVITEQRKLTNARGTAATAQPADTPPGEHLHGVSGEREHDQTE